MEPESIAEEEYLTDLTQEAAEVVDQVSEYGDLIMGSLYLIIGGMFVIYLLHKLASKFLFPHMGKARLIKVIFGTMYVLVLVITALMVLKKIDIDVTVIGQIALVGVLIGAVVIFFLVPFLPRLPFLTGHMIEVNGELGIVDAISAFHTTLRKFDGTMVFLPNALVMASKIKNYSDTPSRRIEIKLSVNTDSDLEETRAIFIRLMSDDDRVLDEPAPPAVFVVNANAAGVDMFAVCWVKNEDWFSTRSELWLKVVDAFIEDSRVAMSLPQQEVYLIEGNEESKENK
jgi:small conductance mechanosensitive channel